jgi:Rieske Fe-S protein
MSELQRDPITRSDFLGLGAIGAVMGALIGIPSVGFVLSPMIKNVVEGESNVSEDWEVVGPVSEIGTEEPAEFVVEFPIRQTYGDDRIQAESGQSTEQFTVRNGIWVSWKSETDELGHMTDQNFRPDFLDEKTEGFTPEEIREIEENLNVLSSICAHLGCPVRWYAPESEFLCPCHGGLYDINGEHIGGPPPHGMFRYTYEVREDGNLYVRHEFDRDPYIV